MNTERGSKWVEKKLGVCEICESKFASRLTLLRENENEYEPCPYEHKDHWLCYWCHKTLVFRTFDFDDYCYDYNYNLIIKGYELGLGGEKVDPWAFRTFKNKKEKLMMLAGIFDSFKREANTVFHLHSDKTSYFYYLPNDILNQIFVNHQNYEEYCQYPTEENERYREDIACGGTLSTVDYPCRSWSTLAP